MLTLPPTVRVFVCLGPTDMRKGFDGLAAATRYYYRFTAFGDSLARG